MHIRKLEISGFKSFVDRTIVRFDHDVIGIVGPNGCGKSNIVDAIRWCMGEQSARQLRGKAMEDVIFNGSETRGASGLAEVTLTFDNSDPEQAATLPVEYRDYPEIAVTRRLYRDGTSQYLVNKVDVRLKDIVDIFLGTGVGTKAYSIVEQGKIGLIVSARPEDRRALIEEAAGITKYKSRKKAAERKMDLTEQNLLRVGDRVGELERNVASLARQAAKAQRYVNYRNELEHLVLHTAAHQLLEIVALEKFSSEQKAEADTAALAARTELDAAEAALETERSAALRLEEEAKRTQGESFAADSRVQALEAEISRQKDRLSHLEERTRVAGQEQADLRRQASALETERAQIQATLASLEAEEARQAHGALSQHEKLEGLRAEEQAADAVVAELRAEASQGSSQVAAAKARLAGLERRTVDMQTRENRLEEQLSALTEEHGTLSTRRTNLAEQVERLAELRETAAADRQTIETERTELRQALTTSERALDVERSTLAQENARLRALKEMRERLEGVADGVKHLMAKRDPTLLGLFVDRIQTPPELTNAVAGLLGPMLDTVIVEESARAMELLQQLARDKKGRATVVAQSVSPVPGRSPGETPDHEGVVGRLIDRLRFAPEDTGLVDALVGDALVVETAAHGVALAAKVRVPIVSLDGTVVHPDGRISGGSTDPVASELVEDQREMHDLRERCAKLTTELESHTEAHAHLRDRMTQLGGALEEARQRAHEQEIAFVSAQKDLKRAEEQLASIERRTATITSELVETRQALAEGDHEYTEAGSALEQGEQAVRQAEQEAETATLTASEWRSQVSAQLAIVTEHKVKLARIREQVASAKATSDRLGRSENELRTRISRLEEELGDCAHQATKSAETLMASEQELASASQIAESSRIARSEAQTAFEAARAVLAERDAQLKDLRTRVAELTERLTNESITLEKLAIRKEHVLAGVRERFRGLDLYRVVGDYHKLAIPDEVHADRITELTRLIDRMGPVNLDATREHDEEKKRLTFFAEQKADLEKALDDLRRAIAQMNRESKRLFRDTFDEVNTRFRDLFPKMFRGGRGELHLTNPEDLLETGIEIIAQPPGKKLGNIELMSGGEKALTAVSLIFALFQFKPSPFCILDEVDAPLDEANVARYNELIRGMTDRSQFILITHIKRTMQSVDLLYGVTMQEPGISRLVSVKVNEAAQQRRPAAGAQQVAVA